MSVNSSRRILCHKGDMKKECYKCKKTKEIGDFNKTVGMCKSCLKIKSRERRVKIVSQIKKIKEATPCLDCHKHYPYYCMDFDHCRGEKTHNINYMVMRRMSFKNIQKEIDKCDLICSNCHRKRTFSRIQDENSKR